MAFDVASKVEVQQYANWANSVRDSQVAGREDGQVANLSKLTSPLTRLFNRSYVNEVRQAAVDGFKKALTDAVGQTIANQAWKAIEENLGKGKGLTAGLIRTAFTETNKIMERHMALMPSEIGADEKALTLRAVCNGGTVYDTKSKNHVYRRSNDIDVPALSTLQFNYNATVAMEKADRLLCKTPASRPEVESFLKEAKKVSRDLKFWTAEHSTSAIQKGIVDRLNAKMTELENKRKEVEVSEEHFPDGEESLRGLADHWIRSLSLACGKLVQRAAHCYKEDPIKREFVKEACVDLLNRYNPTSGQDAMLDKVKSDKKKLPDNLQKELEACVKYALDGKVPAEMKEALKDVFKESHLEVLNKGSWKPIENSFKGFVGGKAVELESDITCGRHIDESIGKNYEKGVQSYNCHTKKTANAVNLATTKLQVTGANGQKRTVFRGVRHGVHSAGKVPGMTTAAANIQRAKQTVTAAFKNYLESFSPKNQVFVGNMNITFDLPMTSISLLTPSKIKEGKMLKAQNAAWKAINGKPMDVTVNGTKYQVIPHIQTFNYGVNKGAVSFGKFSAVTGGWAATAQMNAKALNGLKGQVDEFLKNARADSKTKQAVTTLWNQILRIAVNVNEVVEGNEAYKMPARIAVLTNLMGGVPVWNCKSGKDRTGMLDVEAKFLATLIDQGQPIPEPDAKLSREQSDLLRTIAMKSGNLEMQRYNTGIAGYKLSGVNSVYERLGAGHDEKTTLKGGSGYIGS